MQRTAPSPDGATMSWPSEVAPKPTSSARIFAPRACACSSASSTSMPPPPAMTKPSRAASKAREATCGRSLKPVDMAPIASNSSDNSQLSSSPPPAKTTSCRPQAMSCAACPMQCALVAQAEVIE